MDIAIHTDGFTADEKLRVFITEKVTKLETFYDKIITADVFLKLENNQQVKDKSSEIKINVPGSTLFAAETAKSFEEATDESVDSLRRQLKKIKGKQRANY